MRSSSQDFQNFHGPWVLPSLLGRPDAPPAPRPSAVPPSPRTSARGAMPSLLVRAPSSAAGRLGGAGAALALAPVLGVAQHALLRLAGAPFSDPRRLSEEDAEDAARSAAIAAAASHRPTTRASAKRRRQKRPGGAARGKNAGASSSEPENLKKPLPDEARLLPEGASSDALVRLACSLASWLLPLAALAAPLAAPFLGLLGRLLLALGAFQLAAKTVEARRGRVPAEQDTFLYFACPLEPADEPIDPTLATRVVTAVAYALDATWMAMSYSATRALTPLVVSRVAPRRDLLSFLDENNSEKAIHPTIPRRLRERVLPPLEPRTLTRTYLTAWCLYFLFFAAMRTVAAVQVLATGAAPDSPFRAPLTRSASLREFWSRRWNAPAQRLLKRAAFDPAIDLGFRKPVAVGLTFALSAAMHEYACYVAGVTAAASRGRARSPLAGKQAAYFFFNFVALSIERAIERRSRRFREARPTIRLAIITVWLSWCTTLFVDVLEHGGVMREIDELVGNPIFRLRQPEYEGPTPSY